jgi:hypothetical protein
MRLSSAGRRDTYCVLSAGDRAGWAVRHQLEATLNSPARGPQAVLGLGWLCRQRELRRPYAIVDVGDEVVLVGASVVVVEIGVVLGGASVVEVGEVVVVGGQVQTT